MLLPKALKMRAIKDTMALVADSIGGTKGAPAQMYRESQLNICNDYTAIPALMGLHIPICLV